ncbi:hypothetical protein UC35_06675 [Ramlibacter tataouinensis]|uniref:Uncharacterized protein n=1 Tax=Ramlibacter tataouinensis TaxID=94132 RepID=A0A127JRU0_9BURK|nr:hypothetical protein UC35_06675 [Ramlibacter tataouinensis]
MSARRRRRRKARGCTEGTSCLFDPALAFDPAALLAGADHDPARLQGLANLVRAVADGPGDACTNGPRRAHCA